MDGILNVSPEQLTQTASEFSGKASSISALTTEMTSLAAGLASSWEGAASQAYVSKFTGLEDDIQKMIRMIQEHVTDLEEMATNYTNAENQIVEQISSLSSDVIV